jgi:hypothetical protein
MYKSFDVSFTNIDTGEKLYPGISEAILVKSVQMTDFINGVTCCAVQGIRIVKVLILHLSTLLRQLLSL